MFIHTSTVAQLRNLSRVSYQKLLGSPNMKTLEYRRICSVSLYTAMALSIFVNVLILKSQFITEEVLGLILVCLGLGLTG